MKIRTKIFFALGIAGVLAALTALLLLSGHVSAAIWMEGPYFLLTRLLPGSIDKLWTMVVGVAAYYFAASLIALKHSSRRAVVYIVLIVIALNTLAAFVWHRQDCRHRNPETRLLSRNWKMEHVGSNPVRRKDGQECEPEQVCCIFMLLFD